MSFLLDELLEGPCVDEPYRLQSALPDFHKTAVLLTLTDLTDLVSEKQWSCGRAPDSIEVTVVQSHLPLFRNLGNFVHPTCACVFRKRH